MYLAHTFRFLLAALCCGFVLSQPASDVYLPSELQRRAPYQPTFAELTQTALAFVTDLKAANADLAEKVKVLLVGGTAIWHQFPNGRTTKDADFMVESAKGAPPPKSLKELVMKKFPDKYSVAGGEFVYKLAADKLIGIDAVDITMERPTIRPTGLKTLGEITSISTLPWIKDQELLVLKIISCVERDKPAKAKIDAGDVVSLIQALPKPIRLTANQKKEVDKPEIWKKLAESSNKSEDWFKKELGITRSVSRRPPSPPPRGPFSHGPLLYRRSEILSEALERLARRNALDRLYVSRMLDLDL